MPILQEESKMSGKNENKNGFNDAFAFWRVEER